MASLDGLRKCYLGKGEFASGKYQAETVMDSQEALMPCPKKPLIQCCKIAMVRTKPNVSVMGGRICNIRRLHILGALHHR